MLIDVIDNGLMIYYVSNDYFMVDSSYVFFLFDFLSQFCLEKYVICNIYGLQSPSFESSTVACYICYIFIYLYKQ